MLNKLLFIILLIPYLLSCSKIEENNPSIIKSTKSYKDLLIFNTYKDIYGIDTNTRKVKLHYSFDTQINFGTVSNDDHLYVSSIEKYDASIYKIDPKGNIVARNKSLPNPYTLLVAKDKLIVDSALFDESKYTKLQVFKANDLTQIKNIDNVSNWITNREPVVYKDNAILGIAPIPEYNRNSTTMKLNLETLEVDNITLFTQEYPDEVYTSRIVDDLYVLVFMDSGIIDFYNLEDNRKIKTLSVQELLLDTPLTDLSTIWNYKLISSGENIYVIITDLDNQEIYQYILEIDISSLEVSNVIEFDKNYDLSNFDAKYIANNDIYFQFLNSILVFNLNNGELLLSKNL